MDSLSGFFSFKCFVVPLTGCPMGSAFWTDGRSSPISRVTKQIAVSAGHKANTSRLSPSGQDGTPRHREGTNGQLPGSCCTFSPDRRSEDPPSPCASPA